MDFENQNNQLFTKTDVEKLQLTFILGIFFSAISTIILFLLSSENLSENAKTELKNYLNFELCIFIISIAVNIIPLLGQLACLILFIANLIISLNANKATCEGRIPQYPFMYPIIK